jgi:hypothetical protein
LRVSAPVFQAPTTDEMIRPPGKNWPQAFCKRYPKLKAKRVKALDWNRHDTNIYDKVILQTILHSPRASTSALHNRHNRNCEFLAE